MIGSFSHLARGITFRGAYVPTVDVDIVDVGVELFDSEDLINHAYEIYLKLLTDEFATETFGKADNHLLDTALPYYKGVYTLGTKRSVIAGEWDPVNDDVPESLAVYMDKTIFALRKIDRLPRQFVCAALGRRYMCTSFIFDKTTKLVRRPVVLTDDGRIVAAVSPIERPEAAVPFVAARTLASIAIGMWCDRFHTWQVETSESTISKTVATPLMIGVNEEHMKSLAYARSLPLTATGRKRPILHWVRAHQRRIKEGIDIDIRRHLRGIVEFTMGEFNWRITHPAKYQR